VAAARAALRCSEAQVARQVLADDLVLLGCLNAQIVAAEARMAQLLPDTPFAPLTTVPGWGTVRAANYGAAVGDLDRWPGACQLYRASGLSPAQYESAGKRRDGSISREGSVALRRALIELGLGLWHADPAARRYGQQLRARGKKGGVIGCAMAHRANKIAYAMVRDQSGYDPDRWA
jgi:transposase